MLESNNFDAGGPGVSDHPADQKKGVARISKIKQTEIHLPAHQKKHDSGEILGGCLLCLGDKPFGVEPGFLAVLIDDHLRNWAKEKCSDIEIPESVEDFIGFLGTNKKNAKQIADQLRTDFLKKNVNDAQMWLFKQDYEDPVLFSSHVAPPIERLAKTKTVSKLPKSIRWLGLTLYAFYRNFNGDRSEENRNVIRECISTKLSAAHGMHTQVQELFLGEYKDKFPKIVSGSIWETGLKTFEESLAGDEGHEKFLVKIKEGSRVTTKLNGKKYYVADNSIVDLGMNLPLFILHADRDCVGSGGQNKGRVGNRLFGFDFGQANRGENPLIASLETNFSFVQPKGKAFIKNISLFYDTKLSERMAGLLCFYLITKKCDRSEIFTKEQQKHIEETIIPAYEAKYPHFAERIKKITEGAEEALLESYATIFFDLSGEAREKKQVNRSDQLTNRFLEFADYVFLINDLKTTVVTNRIEMLKKFKERLLLTPDEVDLLNHLELVSGETSALSNDGKVILNHLRLLPDKKPSFWQKLFRLKPEKNRVEWSLLKKDEQIILTAQVSKKQAKELESRLKKYFNFFQSNERGISRSATKINRNNYSVELKFKPAQLKEVLGLFSEESIKFYKSSKFPHLHPKYVSYVDNSIQQPEVEKKYPEKVSEDPIASALPKDLKGKEILKDLEEDNTSSGLQPPKEVQEEDLDTKKLPDIKELDSGQFLGAVASPCAIPESPKADSKLSSVEHSPPPSHCLERSFFPQRTPTKVIVSGNRFKGKLKPKKLFDRDPYEEVVEEYEGKYDIASTRPRRQVEFFKDKIEPPSLISEEKIEEDDDIEDKPQEARKEPFILLTPSKKRNSFYY